MDVREKLVELFYDNNVRCDQKIEGLADDVMGIIDHVVTVQEWVPVNDRLPEVGGYVVCIAKRNPFSRFMPMVARIEKNGWVNPITEQYISEVTNWMPLPKPPKEGICNEKV